MSEGVVSSSVFVPGADLSLRADTARSLISAQVPLARSSLVEVVNGEVEKMLLPAQSQRSFF